MAVDSAHLLFLSTPSELVLCVRGEWHSFWFGEGRLRFSKKAAPPPSATVTRKLEADAVYGVFSLLRGPYVAVVTRSVRVGTAPNGAAIQQVLDMEWLAVGSGSGGKTAPLSASEEEEERAYMSLLRNLGQSRGFYFSLGYDLTTAVQHQPEGACKWSPADDTGLPPQWWLHADERFFWNRGALRDVSSERGFGDAAAGAFAPFISGFVGAAEGGLDVGCESLLLVSRRSVSRQGARFVMRGADADGNVANFVETEQVLRWRDGALAAFVQVRGSIPLLWEQPATLKYAPRATLSSNVQASLAAFQRHAAGLIRRYGRVTAVNLIDRKGDQLKLGSAFEDAARKAVFPAVASAESSDGAGGDAEVSGGSSGGGGGVGGGAASSSLGGSTAPSWVQVWFDFHHECRAMKWGNLKKLLDQVEPQLVEDGFFFAPASSQGGVSGAGGAPSPRRSARTQSGVLRTNCMDNLDRTNVVQSIFFRAAALDAVPGAADAARAGGCSVLTSPFPGFEAAFNALCADNADALSRAYSGTGALKTDFTRTGRRTLRGALSDGMNSCMRYVLNNFADGGAQDAWDLFLGRYVPERVRSERAVGDGKRARGGLLPPYKAHAASPTPRRVLGASLALWAGLSLALAAFVMPRVLSPDRSRIAWGFAGATLAVGALATVLLRSGAPQVLRKAVVSRPAFVTSSSSLN